ncbi:MAG TPA: MFS transporter [Steroidobacteraceae bacterium]|jgi:MFS family permease
MALRQTAFYGWKLLAACWVIMFLNLGIPVYGASGLNALMAPALHLDRSALGLLFSAYMIMSGLPGPLVALSVNRYGVRGTLMLGSVLLIAGALLMGTVVNSFALAVLAFGLLVGGGVATGAALAAQAGLARWFVRRRALVLSILYSSGAVGGFVSGRLLDRVVRMAGGNWRAGWWVIAALSAIACAVAAVFVKESPAQLGQFPDGEVVTSNRISASSAERTQLVAVTFRTTQEWTYRRAVSSPAYWVMVLALLGVSCGYTLYLAHGFVHLRDLGHSSTEAWQAISVLAVSGLLAKIIIASCGDRLDPRYLWAAFQISFGIGLAVVVNARSHVSVLVFATCLGIGFGGGLVCLMAVLSNYFGTRLFASLAGLAVAVNTTLSAITPYVAGWRYDTGHGYGASFYFLSLWSLIGGAALLLLRPPSMPAAAALVPLSQVS